MPFVHGGGGDAGAGAGYVPGADGDHVRAALAESGDHLTHRGTARPVADHGEYRHVVVGHRERPVQQVRAGEGEPRNVRGLHQFERRLPRCRVSVPAPRGDHPVREPVPGRQLPRCRVGQHRAGLLGQCPQRGQLVGGHNPAAAYRFHEKQQGEQFSGVRLGGGDRPLVPGGHVDVQLRRVRQRRARVVGDRQRVRAGFTGPGDHLDQVGRAAALAHPDHQRTGQVGARAVEGGGARAGQSGRDAEPDLGEVGGVEGRVVGGAPGCEDHVARLPLDDLPGYCADRVELGQLQQRGVPRRLLRDVRRHPHATLDHASILP